LIDQPDDLIDDDIGKLRRDGAVTEVIDRVHRQVERSRGFRLSSLCDTAEQAARLLRRSRQELTPWQASCLEWRGDRRPDIFQDQIELFWLPYLSLTEHKAALLGYVFPGGLGCGDDLVI